MDDTKDELPDFLDLKKNPRPAPKTVAPSPKKALERPGGSQALRDTRMGGKLDSEKDDPMAAIVRQHGGIAPDTKPDEKAAFQAEDRAAQKEKRKEKSRVRVEKLRAKKAGETAKMPASGREALDIIKAAQSKESPVRTNVETTTPKKLPVPPPKVRESVLKTKKAAPPKKAKAKPVAKAKPEKKAGVLGIGEIAKRAILDGCTNEEALAKVKKVYPDGNTNESNMSWYRNFLRKAGLLKDTPMGQKAAAKVKAAKAKASVKKAAK